VKGKVSSQRRKLARENQDETSRNRTKPTRELNMYVAQNLLLNSASDLIQATRTGGIGDRIGVSLEPT